MDLGSLDLPFFLGILVALAVALSGSMSWSRRRQSSIAAVAVVGSALLLATWVVLTVRAASLTDLASDWQ
jgi:hypothetical protein